MSLIIKNGSVKKSKAIPGAGPGKMSSEAAKRGLLKLKQHKQGMVKGK